MNANMVLAMMKTEDIVGWIRRYRDTQGWSKNRLASEAGIQDTVLRSMDEDDWNPTRKTLDRLLAVIPEDFETETDETVEAA